MSLTASQLEDLRGKAKLLLGIDDDDPSFLIDALAVYDDESSNSTSATIAVDAVQVQHVGDTSGTTNYNTAQTIPDLAADINEGSDGLVATALVGDEVDAGDLVRRAATNILGQSNEVILAAENTALLDLLIEGALKAIETYLGRNLLSQSYTERVYPCSGGLVTLEQPNVTGVDVFSIEPDDAITVRYSGSDPIARVEVTDTACILRSSGSSTTTTNLAFSTYGDTGALATAIDGTSGWTASARVTVPTSRLVRSPSWDAKRGDIELEYWRDYDGDYEVDYGEGQLRIEYPSYWSSYSYRGMGYVAYTAGFESLPKDIELVVLALTKGAYDAANRDGSLQSERLGDYSYQVASDAIAGGISDAAIVSQLPTLERYRRMLP